MSKVFTITEGLENLGALRTGGQGSVYKARRYGPIITAVKLIPTPVIAEDNDDKNYRNFNNEVEKLKRVNQEANPNVVKILSSGVTESGAFPFIEMEYIEGPDLEDLLKSPHDPVFTIKEIIKVADQLACAISHCHKVGVKHGDVKSNNVKFNIHTGNYVLLDFGLAVMSDEQRRTSMRHAGAIEFMAPEQNEGDMLFQSDIYSYGVILFELIAGRVPFQLDDSGETARNTVRLQHIEQEVPDVMQLRAQNLPGSWSDEKKETEMQVPQWLVNMVTTCLKKKPAERYADGIKLHDAIVTNAISGGTNGELQAEVDKLRDELKREKQQHVAVVQEPVAAEPAYNNSGGVRVAKPVFVLMLLCLIGFAAATGYFALKPANAATQQNMAGIGADSAGVDGGSEDSIVTGTNVDAGYEGEDTTTATVPQPKTVDTPKYVAPKKVPDNIPDTSIKPQIDTTLY